MTVDNLRRISTAHLSLDQEVALFERHKNGDAKATDALLRAHMAMINKIAGKYTHYGYQHDDVVQEAILGFLHGLERFDPSLGNRINTHARFWIKAFIMDYMRSNHSIVKLGTTANQKKLYANLSKAKNRHGFTDANLNDIQAKVLAEELDVSVAEIHEMNVRLFSSVKSINQPVSEEDGSTFYIDMIEDESQSIENVNEHIDRNTMARLLESALNNLDNRKRDIVTRRYLKDEIETLDQVSKIYGISRERVRQIEVVALKELKKKLPKQISDFFSSNDNHKKAA